MPPLVTLGRGGVGGSGAGGGAAGTFTVTRAMSLALPPGPVAVAWYVTEDAGFTERLPVNGTSPTAGVIVTFAAFRASHCKVVEPPRSIVAGCARNVIVGAGGGGAGGVVTTGLGGTVATFFGPHADATSVDTISSISPILLMRDKVIVESP